jgi:hypothetical protein
MSLSPECSESVYKPCRDGYALASELGILAKDEVILWQSPSFHGEIRRQIVVPASFPLTNLPVRFLLRRCSPVSLPRSCHERATGHPRLGKLRATTIQENG